MERLAALYEVTVFTTCARDYVTWRNELPEGPSREGRALVRRFPVEEERDLAAFNAFAEPLYVRPHGVEDERLFLRRQGPFVPRLVEALRARLNDFRTKTEPTLALFRKKGLIVQADGTRPPAEVNAVLRQKLGLPART